MYTSENFHCLEIKITVNPLKFWLSNLDSLDMFADITWRFSNFVVVKFFFDASNRMNFDTFKLWKVAGKYLKIRLKSLIIIMSLAKSLRLKFWNFTYPKVIPGISFVSFNVNNGANDKNLYS